MSEREQIFKCYVYCNTFRVSILETELQEGLGCVLVYTNQLEPGKEEAFKVVDIQSLSLSLSVEFFNKSMYQVMLFRTMCSLAYRWSIKVL